MSWINPIRIARNAQLGWRVIERGGPRAVRVQGIDPPTGWLLPSSDVHLEVETADGGTVDLDVALPLPPLYGWGWRIGRKAGVPLISDVDPGRVRFGVPLPFGRGSARDTSR